MNQGLRRRFKFFHKWAGGIVGQSAIVAIELARSEIRMEEDGFQIEHVLDYDVDLSWCDDADMAKLESGYWSCIGLVLKDKDGNPLESLWGIVGPNDANDPYPRVVAAELAREHYYAKDRKAETLARGWSYAHLNERSVINESL